MDKKLSELLSNDAKWCHTICKIVTVDFHWTIENFSFLNKKVNECVESSVFSSSASSELKWKLQLYPYGQTGSTESLGLYLKLCSFKRTNIIVHFTLSILKSNGSHFSRTFTKHDFPNGWGHSNFMNIEDLNKKENGYLQDDALHIICKIKASTGKVECYNQDLTDLETPDLYKNLSEDLGGILESEKFSDVCLEVDNVKFNVHKNIMSARSPVFAAMLDHDMMETRENVIKIKDTKPEIAKAMLSYIYTGNVDDIETKVLELFKISDKYDLAGLKVLCENTLCKLVTVENVAEILYVADLHNSQKLKQVAINLLKFDITDQNISGIK